ncbi:MAG TPA: YbaK/EbsC family protein [Microlunatus sp.]|nr:YbaK/EbsC family protein [Microlunatus sp.]
MTSLHPSCAAIDALLAAAGVPGRVRLLPDAAPTAQAAADQLGCELGAIANSLIFLTADDRPLLIMTSGAHRVDTTRIGELLGAPIRRAGADMVRRATGQPIGGVAPIGHPVPIRTLVDEDLRAYDPLWAAGGIPHAVFPISFEHLVALTGGEVVGVA